VNAGHANSGPEVSDASASFQFGGSFGRPNVWCGLAAVTDDTMKKMLQNGVSIKGVTKVSIDGSHTVVTGMVTSGDAAAKTDEMAKPQPWKGLVKVNEAGGD